MQLYDYIDAAQKHGRALNESAASAALRTGVSADHALTVAKHLAEAAQEAAKTEPVRLQAPPVAN